MEPKHRVFLELITFPRKDSQLPRIPKLIAGASLGRGQNVHGASLGSAVVLLRLSLMIATRQATVLRRILAASGRRGGARRKRLRGVRQLALDRETGHHARRPTGQRT